MSTKSNKKVNLNDEDSLKSIINEIAKDKSKNGKASFPQRLITFFTKNMGVTAGLAVYFILSGIIANFVLIVKNPISSFVIIAILAVSVFLILKIKVKKV